MRSALLFAVRLLVPGIVLVYVLAMLATPCMPLPDAMGEVQAIPRWEYWLLHASVPSAVWWQWTGGFQPIAISDRIPILLGAGIWLSACLLVGSVLCRFDPVLGRLSKYERLGVSILVGQSSLSAAVFLYGWLVGTATLVWLLSLLLVAAFVLVRSKFIPCPADDSGGDILSNAGVDASFSSSIKRRMVGLLFLACAFLACVQVIGATIPTRDMHVREIDWWIVKHAALRGNILWSHEHALANAPAGLDMPSLACASLLTMNASLLSNDNNPSLEQREHLNERLFQGVLVGKTVNAMLCLVGILLASVHVGRRWGYLSGLFVCFSLLATPGIAELTRLGRTEALVGIWIAALLVVWHASRESMESKLSLNLVFGFLMAGAFGSGYGSAAIVGLPAAALWMWTDGWKKVASIGSSTLQEHTLPTRRLATSILFIAVFLSASAFYIRNAIASGDPIYPWGAVVAFRLGIGVPSDLTDSIAHAYRVPYETTFESLANASNETPSTIPSDKNVSPFRLLNLLDGAYRILGNSSAHGLVLVPFAIVGVLFGKFKSTGLAVFWFATWVFGWWCFSTRQDRDWVGALILLAWPAAAGADWMAGQKRGYAMMPLALIALVWSVVVIPIWPTSDNRMLVALKMLNATDRNTVTLDEAGQNSDGTATLTISSRFNSELRQLDPFAAPPVVLLVGGNDDFAFLAECVSNGPFDRGLMDESLELTGKSVGAKLREQGISHLLVDWTGVQYREGLTGRKTENAYRAAIDRWQSESQLRSIPWEINSSQAELFRVNQE